MVSEDMRRPRVSKNTINSPTISGVASGVLSKQIVIENFLMTRGRPVSKIGVPFLCFMWSWWGVQRTKRKGAASTDLWSPIKCPFLSKVHKERLREPKHWDARQEGFHHVMDVMTGLKAVSDRMRLPEEENDYFTATSKEEEHYKVPVVCGLEGIRFSCCVCPRSDPLRWATVMDDALGALEPGVCLR